MMTMTTTTATATTVILNKRVKTQAKETKRLQYYDVLIELLWIKIKCKR